LSGEGAKVRSGDSLHLISENLIAKAYSFYVLSVSTDTVTATAQYQGGPAVAVADLNGALLEQNPLVPELRIHNAVDAVFNNFLWPHAYTYANYTITPDLTTMQVALNAAVEDVTGAKQIIGSRAVNIGFAFERDLSTGVEATGVQGTFAFIDGSSTYITAKEKYKIGDESSDNGLVDLVAFGAAAICLNSAVTGGMQERSRKDATTREIASRDMWQTHLALRAGRSEDLSRDGHHFLIERG